MKGYIFTFGDNLTPSEMVQRHNEFFGRVSRVKRGGKTHHYYYPGVLDNIKFYKITRGCYFIPLSHGKILVRGQSPIEAELEVKELKTAREYFLEKYAGKKVNNLD